jgi:signal transduction histidine kinase
MRLPRPGLRTRLVAALVLTAGVTLAVASLTLLSPLEHKLRDREVRNLAGAAIASRPTFEELTPRGIEGVSPRLIRLVGELGRRTQAHVAIFDGTGKRLIDTDPVEPIPTSEILPALHSRLPLKRLVPSRSVGEALVATRFMVDHQVFVVALRKSLDEVASAIDDVKAAVLRAAIAGLIVAIALGAGLATALLKRLRRLHEATLRFGQTGEAHPIPGATHRDEIGDLARAFGAMEQRVERQEEVRRAFVATASHELRTPLMSLSGMLELLEEDLGRTPPNIDDARRQVTGAREQSERMTRLAADLLDVSRLDAKLQLRSEPTELAEISRAVIAELGARAKARGISITLNVTGPCWALADPTATARILRILLDNALRYTPQDAPIAVAVDCRARVPVVTVRDRGPGVPEADRELIFDRFTRGSASTQEGGFGLGLAIGRELAVRMGGSLDLLDSQDGGAVFALELPRAAGNRSGDA